MSGCSVSYMLEILPTGLRPLVVLRKVAAVVAAMRD